MGASSFGVGKDEIITMGFHRDIYLYFTFIEVFFYITSAGRSSMPGLGNSLAMALTQLSFRLGCITISTKQPRRWEMAIPQKTRI